MLSGSLNLTMLGESTRDPCFGGYIADVMNCYDSVLLNTTIVRDERSAPEINTAR